MFPANGNMVALRIAVDKDRVHCILRALFAKDFIFDAREIIRDPAGRAAGSDAAFFHASVVKGHKFVSDAVIVEDMTAGCAVCGLVVGIPDDIAFLVVVVLQDIARQIGDRAAARAAGQQRALRRFVD